MITTRTAPRTRRFLIAAFVLSVLIHLCGGALWAQATHAIAQMMRRLPAQHQPEQYVATSDVIHLEKRTVPRKAVASRVVPHVVPVRATPARVAVRAQPQPQARHAVRTPASPAPVARPEIAHLAEHAPRHAEKPDLAKGPGAAGGAKTTTAARKAALSAAELAQLNAQFAKTIASSHTDLATIEKREEAQPVAVSRRPLQFNGIQGKLQRGQGYISPTTVGRRIGNTMWYYAHYTYMWPDGHIEEDDIPWPFRFPVAHDPFATPGLADVLIPLQLPPPGFRIDRPLKPLLARFLRVARGAG